MSRIVEQIDFSISFYQGVLGATTILLPFLTVNLLTISEFNRFQTLSKIYFTFLGAVGMLLPNIWRTSSDESGKEVRKIMIRVKGTLFLICSSLLLSTTLYFFWDDLFTKVLSPSVVELAMWSALTCFAYLNIQIFYELVSRKYYKVLQYVYSFYFIVYFVLFVFLYIWRTTLSGEIFLLVIYMAFTFFVLICAKVRIIL
jgi:hypothetical protein